ncbi:hypothetical protein EOE67_16240 [Rheinheimera riviphila]|uniref:Uncharacterized protein n=1 Tax=Rheinheimera riviphila TaxID=1834037 RepID=A0A437QG93_9GAMM|nr:hypothetical protein [Rheinheimera riviphila]RVU33565.1 hypothetical protein EOE67_16240 [Rheinheimera riviphila]
MSLLTRQSLLPKARLEQDLQLTLGSRIAAQLTPLQQQRPRIYRDMQSDWLTPYQPPLSADHTSMQQPTPLPSDLSWYWQQLILPDQSICSELVLMRRDHILYLTYLNILPADFGLFSPLWPQQAMRYADQLIAETLGNIAAFARAQHDLAIVTTLTNPNLAAIFVHQHFQKTPSGSQIVGFPLPARYVRLLAPTPHG